MHSIPEEEFETTWNTLHKLIGIMHTDYTAEDLSYEKLTVNKESYLNSSH